MRTRNTSFKQRALKTNESKNKVVCTVQNMTLCYATYLNTTRRNRIDSSISHMILTFVILCSTNIYFVLRIKFLKAIRAFVCFMIKNDYIHIYPLHIIEYIPTPPVPRRRWKK